MVAAVLVGYYRRLGEVGVEVDGADADADVDGAVDVGVEDDNEPSLPAVDAAEDDVDDEDGDDDAGFVELVLAAIHAYTYIHTNTFIAYVCTHERTSERCGML